MVQLCYLLLCYCTYFDETFTAMPFMFFIVVVIPGHNLDNSQVSVNRTIGPTLVNCFYCSWFRAVWQPEKAAPYIVHSAVYILLLVICYKEKYSNIIYSKHFFLLFGPFWKIISFLIGFLKY